MASGGGGRGALSHPALGRDPHRDLTFCHQESGRWVPGSADTCGHNDKLESGFSRPPALSAWRNRGGQQPASKKRCSGKNDSVATGLPCVQDPGTNHLVNGKPSQSLTAETATLHFTRKSTGRAHRW